ncbi:gamma-glutamyltranspeptidase [Trametes versicolor FP-101664 SS1]|uniref:gamma-glutamyltranspeptidase n=1 Tax=Trametes versicolor (strain FP-101664) TaxID=717944 RepID=UPI0004621B58|nr:gamma-glutamyltranspeptidase [Trametes versicolor FP-101664 SS1]EIW63497.1 gamma-glutamyltranspeptidase [Trametes versicolor FP-101664 SS1]
MQKPGILAEPPQPPRARCVSWRIRACLAGIALWGTYQYSSSLQWNGDQGPLCGLPALHKSSRTRVPSAGRNPAYLVRATNGAVASENELCSDIGVNILKDGGNAVDATVGTTLCIGVVNMFSSGIGGGGFMTVRIPPASPGAASEVFSIDFRETAPALSNKTMYVDDPLAARWGGLAVGVPGELRGLEEAHKRWGKLPWKTLVQPAIRLAEGWTVQTELDRRLEMFAPLMLNHPDWKPIFAPEGHTLKTGETIRRTNLSRTLAAIAEGGADAFYTGPIADAIVEKVRVTGGILSHADLAQYEVQVKRALQGTYRGRTVYTPHAPTSGPVLIHMLNLMEHYDDLAEEGRTVVNVHRAIEAMKFGFAARTRIGDPLFHDEVHRIHEIPTKQYADDVFPNITDDTTHSPEYYKPIYDIVEDHGTSHSSFVDKDGMAVALTTTVNLIFGSAVLDPVTGVILNDEMDDFSTPGMPNAFGLYPSPYNYPEPGKRPLSSTTPTIVEHEDGSFYAAIGGSGGSRIFPAVFQVLLNMDWGMDVSAAIEYGRLHDQLFPTMVDTDDTLPAELIDGLIEKGHNISVAEIDRVAAVIQVVAKLNDTIYAASDSRKNGIAAGY